MSNAQHAPRDACLTRTTSGWWEVELFEIAEMPSGDTRMAHYFRDYFEHVDIAAGVIRDWLDS